MRALALLGLLSATALGQAKLPLEATGVTLSTAQTITGAKTFSAQLLDTAGVAVSSNQKVCLDGAACTRYLQYNSSANRVYIAGTSSEYYNFNQNVEFSGAGVFEYGILFMTGSKASSYITAQAPATDVFVSHSGGLCVGDGTSTECDGKVTYGFDVVTVQTLTVPDNGSGTAATATLTPTSSYVDCVCNDANGCTISLGETGMVDGTLLRVITSTANACSFADSSGVSETTGTIAVGQWDSIMFLYKSDRWVELGTSNN